MLSAPYLFYLDWNSLDYPVVILTAWPNLRLGSQADDYSWNLGGAHSQTFNVDISIPTTTTEARSLMKSAVLGDYISYEIVSPLQVAGDLIPESGEIQITGGSGNGSIRMVIESATSVRLEIDVEGDGTVDDYQYTTWGAKRIASVKS
jgi:ribosomal protein S6E (S10)